MQLVDAGQNWDLIASELSRTVAARKQRHSTLQNRHKRRQCVSPTEQSNKRRHTPDAEHALVPSLTAGLPIEDLVSESESPLSDARSISPVPLLMSPPMWMVSQSTANTSDAETDLTDATSPSVTTAKVVHSDRSGEISGRSDVMRLFRQFFQLYDVLHQREKEEDELKENVAKGQRSALQSRQEWNDAHARSKIAEQRLRQAEAEVQQAQQTLETASFSSQRAVEHSRGLATALVNHQTDTKLLIIRLQRREQHIMAVMGVVAEIIPGDETPGFLEQELQAARIDNSASLPREEEQSALVITV